MEYEEKEVIQVLRTEGKSYFLFNTIMIGYEKRYTIFNVTPTTYKNGPKGPVFSCPRILMATHFSIENIKPQFILVEKPWEE